MVTTDAVGLRPYAPGDWTPEEMYRAEVRAFLATVLEGAQNGCPPAEALHVVDWVGQAWALAEGRG